MSTVSWISRSVAPCSFARLRHRRSTSLPSCWTLPAMVSSALSLGLMAAWRSRLHLLDKSLVAAEVGRCDGSVNAVAIVGAVAAGDIRGNQFALAAAERAWPGEKDFDEGIQRPRCLRPKRHGAADAGQIGERAMCGIVSPGSKSVSVVRQWFRVCVQTAPVLHWMEKVDCSP